METNSTRQSCWLWPDRIIYIRESGRLKREHNQLVREHALAEKDK